MIFNLQKSRRMDIIFLPMPNQAQDQPLNLAAKKFRKLGVLRPGIPVLNVDERLGAMLVAEVGRVFLYIDGAPVTKVKASELHGLAAERFEELSLDPDSIEQIESEESKPEKSSKSKKTKAEEN